MTGHGEQPAEQDLTTARLRNHRDALTAQLAVIDRELAPLLEAREQVTTEIARVNRALAAVRGMPGAYATARAYIAATDGEVTPAGGAEFLVAAGWDPGVQGNPRTAMAKALGQLARDGHLIRRAEHGRYERLEEPQ